MVFRMNMVQLDSFKFGNQLNLLQYVIVSLHREGDLLQYVCCVSYFFFFPTISNIASFLHFWAIDLKLGRHVY